MDKQEDIFSRGIGNKEGKKSLTAKPVVCLSVQAEGVYKKGTLEADKSKTKPIGNKLVLVCKHPDKEESVKISSLVCLKNKTLTNSTIWINVDEDGNIQKGSTVALLLEKYQSPTIDMLVGKTLQTEIGEDSYLTIKAY